MNMGVTRRYEQTLTCETHARTFLTTKSPHRDASGRIIGVLGLAYDITLRKHMEDELQRRLAVENTLAHISFRFVAPADLDTCIEETLADLGALTGATAAYASVIAQHGGPVRRHAWHASEAAVLQDAPFDLESMPESWRVRLGAGSHVVVTDAGSAAADEERKLLEAAKASALVILPVFTRDGLMGVLTLNHDAIRTWHEHELRMLEIVASILGTSVQRHAAEARLRLSEERFRLLSTASPVGVFVTDVDGRITYANRRCATIIGHDGIVGQDWHAFVDAGQAKDAEAWTLRASGSVPFSRMLSIVSEGEPRWAHLRAAHLQSEDGRHVGYVGTIEDVSDLRRAQEELQMSRQQLAVSEKMSALGTLVSGVAHEIRTPLTYVANHLHIIRHRMQRDDPQMKALREWLEPHAVGALEGVDRINHLVHDLRRFTQLDLGERTQLDLAAVVDEAVHLFRSTHRGQVLVDARLAPIPSLAMNKVQIQQVVINLLQNASEAMEHRGTIRVATRQTATGHVRLVVEDEGPGIPPNVKKHVLEPFYTTKRDGTGLGLSIVARIVREHAGQLSFEDAGPGTRVVVELARPVA